MNSTLRPVVAVLRVHDLDALLLVAAETLCAIALGQAKKGRLEEGHSERSQRRSRNVFAARQTRAGVVVGMSRMLAVVMALLMQMIFVVV